MVVKRAYAYDYNRFYAELLGDPKCKFRIPNNEGKHVFMEKLPAVAGELPYGYYRAKITCDDERMRRVFSFSKDNVYTHYCIGFAMVLKNTFPTLKIDLDDESPNCYHYAGEDLEFTHLNFGN